MHIQCPTCRHWHHTTPDREQAHCPGCGAEFPTAHAATERERADDPAVERAIDAQLERQRAREGG